MTSRLPTRSIYFTVAAGLSLLVMGCSSPLDTDAATAANNKTNLQKLTNLYFAFQMKNDFIGPTNENEFRKFIENYPSQKLKRIGINANSLDALFTNERDGEPFKIRFEVQGSLMGSSEPVIFESKGVGGQKRVGFLDMTQRDVQADEYNELWEGRFTPANDSRN